MADLDVSVLPKTTSKSVDGAGGYGPLVGLTGDGDDVLEVEVVVEHDHVEGFGGGGDEQVGDLAAALASCRRILRSLVI